MSAVASCRYLLLASAAHLTLIEPASAARHDPAHVSNKAIERPNKGARHEPSLIVAPPPGFENLTKARELLVDIVYAEQRLGQVTVIVTPGHVEFKEPAKALALIEGVKQTKPIVEALTGALPANTALVCRRRQDVRASSDCGALEPKVAGVIFDENNLAIHVFIAASFLDPRALSARKFLARPDGGWGFLSRFDAAVSGQTGDKQLHTLHNRNYLSFREARLHTDVSLSTRNGLITDTLALEMDRPEWFYAAGFFRGFGSPLVPEARFYGGRVWSSTELRIDREQAFGSQLAIFLQRPAYIEVLRDGRLLSTHYYPAGNRIVDTSALPGGAYNVTLRVREIGGATREETRFFAKTEILPPADQPLFFFDGGVLAADRASGLPPPSTTPIGKAAARVRIWHGFAIGGEVAGTRREGVFEGSAYLLSPLVRATASALVTSALDYGASASLAGNYGQFGFYLNGRYVRAARSFIERPGDPANFRFINGSSIQLNGSITYQLKRARLGLTGQLQRNSVPGNSETYAFGPNFQYKIHESHEHFVGFEAEFLKTERGYSTFAKIVWRWQPPANYYVNGEAGVRAQRQGQGTELRDIVQINGRYRLGPYFDHDFAVEPSVQRDGNTLAGIDGTAEGPLGRARAGVHHAFDGRGKPSTGYGLNVSTGFAVDKNGFALGGRESAPAAVIVRVKGPANAGKYRVMVNGSPRMLMNAGETRPLNLLAYHAYEISLQPADTNTGMANIGSVNRKLVLYPGTTRTLEWNVEPVIVVFGRALHGSGAPVAGAKIEGVVGVGESDERGYFQVEVNKEATLVFRDEKNAACEVNLGKLKLEGDNFARVGDVACAPRK